MTAVPSTEEFDEYRIDQAERWLEHVRDLRLTVRAMQVDIGGERELIDGMRGIGTERVSGSHDPDRMSDTIARYEAKLDELRQWMDHLLEDMDEARECIARIPDGVSSSLLTMRFVDGLTWDEVCGELGYSFHHVMRLRRRALLQAYDVMPTRWRDPAQPAV